MSDNSTDDLPYRVEYARSGRSKCRVCYNLIYEGELRIASYVQSYWNNGRMPWWHHCSCFFEDHHPKTTAEIENFENISCNEQYDIQIEIGLNTLSEEYEEDDEDEDDEDDEEDKDEVDEEDEKNKEDKDVVNQAVLKVKDENVSPKAKKMKLEPDNIKNDKDQNTQRRLLKITAPSTSRAVKKDVKRVL